MSQHRTTTEGPEPIAVGGLLPAVDGMGAWFAEGLAEHDRRGGGFGTYRFRDVETESWRVVLGRLAFSAVTVAVGVLRLPR